MNKYWPSKQPALRNSVKPFHTVTHREIGDIPGCTPAPRSGTFVNTSHEEARSITLARADKYAEYLSAYCNGQYGGQNGLKEMWAKVSSIPPMYGAYGEKL